MTTPNRSKPVRNDYSYKSKSGPSKQTLKVPGKSNPPVRTEAKWEGYFTQADENNKKYKMLFTPKQFYIEGDTIQGQGEWEKGFPFRMTGEIDNDNYIKCVQEFEEDDMKQYFEGTISHDRKKI